jgi:H+-transporting ATPase
LSDDSRNVTAAPTEARARSPRAGGAGSGRAEDLEALDLGELFEILGASREGLDQAEAAKRLDRYGRNEIPERRASVLRQIFGYFWGPIPWMIEVAAVLSAVVRHWVDLVIIVILLVFNAAVGFWQEKQAADAVAALKQNLAPRARVLRAGAWQEIAAAELVPGDVVQVHLGDVVPADIRLFDAGSLAVDQSALTGESLPVTKQAGDACYAGSVAKRGEMTGVVTATGLDTFFGRTAALVAEAGAPSHFQQAVLRIGDYLIALSLGLVAILVLVQLARGAPALELVQFALILTVAAIPVAMPAVLSVTMAIGARALARERAIVTRLESIEEMAGADVVCSDKTGTLTRNELSLGSPVLFGGLSPDEVVNVAALTCHDDHDPIDDAVLAAAGPVEGYTEESFTPFDPTTKRATAVVHDQRGNVLQATKGAPQVIIDLCKLDADSSARAESTVDQLAGRGFRTLGVAQRHETSGWEFLGVLPLSDPPREDARDTIERAADHGVEVKMITGDDVAIAREIAAELGLGTNIELAGDVPTDATDDRALARVGEEVERSDGFARVFPEHKYTIVKALQARGHLVAMTGDGVNDAPALRQADVGIAVSGATDAARAAADLVLTAPGLATIIAAIEHARKIFERMTSYAIYRITETIRIMLFVVATMLIFDFYPINAVMIILLALLNDIPIMTIAVDNTWLDPEPVRWQMHRVLTVSTVLGVVGVIGSFGILLASRDWLHLSDAEIQTLVFLKLAVAGHLTLFVTRTRRFFLSRPYPAPAMLWSAIVTKIIATLLVAYGFGLITPISWKAIGVVWAYAIAWMFIADGVKLLTYRHLDLTAGHQRRFLARLQHPMHPFGARKRDGAPSTTS